MHTQKLFYEDCSLRQFTACVTGCQKTDKGYAVTLDRTAFYPEGGGQACDTGILGSARVLDVRESDGQIIHLCDSPLSPGETAEGRIDYDRRFDLMQQHSGEHIVSGIVHKRFGFHNVGFHMGADVMEVDFDGFIPPEAIAQIELEANKAVWANLPVRCWYPSPEELPHVTYRTKRILPWPVRIVDIPDIDTCACCGIHVAATGQIGIIKILSCVKFRGGVRLEISCGARATTYLNRIFEENRQVSQAFSAKPLETGAAAHRMNELLAAEKFRCAGLQKQLFEKLAADYTGKGDVLVFYPGLTSAEIRELAEKIASSCNGTAAVLCEGKGRLDVCLVNLHGDVKELGSAMSQALGGRGGGKHGFFQGSLTTDRKAAEDFFARFGFDIS
ncbi:MAG: alanyl-tRNA editing protein [Oscillospiraceae bacterium]|nr:alanyl-tRNA editing protein [Oscillospiraceae bacterium]